MSSWPPKDGRDRKVQALDASQLIGWKTWIAREERLPRSPQAVFADRPLLSDFMARQNLRADPAYAPAPNNLRGASRHGWESFKSGSDPLVGYNPRWAAARTRQPTPFTAMRQRSQSAHALQIALEPLHIRPVDRALVASRTRAPPKAQAAPAVHRVMSMAELAPELPERRARGQTEFSAQTSSIQSIAFSQRG